MLKLWKQVQDNFLFVVVCIAIVAALALLAWCTERFLPKRRTVSSARKITIVGIFAAIATILHMIDFPLIFLAPEFYKLDFSEVPVLLCGFYLGPLSTVACEGIKILLKLLLKGTSTAFVGDFANFVVGCSLVLPATIIYHIRKTKASALVGMVAGTLCIAVFGSAFNALYLLPKFAQLYGIPLNVLISMGAAIHSGVNSVGTFVLLCVAPLNLLKGAVVSLLTFLLYKRIKPVLFPKE